MNILLDNHSFLWLINGDKRLGKAAEKAFLTWENRIFFSAV